MHGSKWRREETGTSRASTGRTEPGASRRPYRLRLADDALATPQEQLCQDRRMADKSVADQLRELGVKNANVLVRMAERGQLLALRCEMPQCYHHKGRGAFDQVTTPRTKWAPSPDHYPVLKSAGGHLRPENVRLAHIYCNKRDYGRRKQIRTLLAKGKSLAEIAEVLNRKGVPPAHGTNRWTAAMVRKAYVS
jgi:hypothetical protein